MRRNLWSADVPELVRPNASPETEAHDSRGLVGRVNECGQIDALLEGARTGRRGLLVIRGEAGAGKTALLRYAQERAGEMRVVSATGVRGDADVPFAGLLELTLPLIDLMDLLPRPQHHALSVALARAPIERTLDRFAVGAGLLSLFAAAAERSGIVVLIDDLHWLDAASAEAIVFAARRLADARALFLFAARDDERVPADISGLPAIVATRLDRSATATLAARARGLPISSEFAERIFAITGGNPLAISELRAGTASALPVGATPVSQAIEEEFGARAAALPAAARTALLVVAADDALTTTTCRAVFDTLGVDDSALEQAERAGLLVRSQQRLAFRHPLVRSAIFQQAGSGDRRRVHAAIADALTSDADSVRRTLHQASAADAPDAGLATALEKIGDDGFHRHAYTAAALAFEQAAALTPDDVPRDVRLSRAATSRYLSGDVDRARASLDAAVAICRIPRLRVDLMVLQGEMLCRSGESAAALELLIAESRAVESIDPAGAAVLLDVAFVAAMFHGDVARAVEVAERAAPLRGGVAPRNAGAFCVAGRPWDETAPVLRRAIGDHPRDDPNALCSVASLVAWLGEYRDAYALSLSALEAACEAGAPVAAADAARLASDLAFTVGDWRAAASHGDEAFTIHHRHGGQRDMLRSCAWTLAILAAAEGRAAGCGALLNELGGGRPLSWFGIRDAAACVCGHLCLGLGDAAGAVAAFERGVDLDVEQVGHIPVTPAFDLVEAYVRAGDRRAAERAVDRVRDHAHQPWAVAALARSQGLLADAQEGDDLFVSAIETGTGQGTPFEEARSRLLYGEWLRRARRRTDARQQLRAGLQTFERLGARSWAVRARQELSASGETHIARADGDPIDSLTPQERRTALLAGDGVSNREIAARLFLSTKTVEAHLHRVYRKLGVTRRTDLAATLLRADAEHSGPADFASDHPGSLPPRGVGQG